VDPVEHLGVDPVKLVEQVRGSEFHPVGYESPPAPGTAAPDQRLDWTLQSGCDSAALHVALERQADAAATAARNLYKAIPDEELLDALPKHVNTDALLADGERNYEAPPPRFQLAEDGVKPLIMGTQLYGDRMLAVRELYQNALDACRRRWARQKYAQETGLSDFGASGVKELAEYTIEFVLGRDEHDGRIYIECVDHGIGMAEEELRDLFARAGRRYEQSPTRVRELRRWRRAGIDPELNSRFGIGVFSYFMLAEDIRVTTRPANETGRTAEGPGHRVDVVADSGLMYIRKAEHEDAGTRVRLYLRPEDRVQPPSLIRFLREQVWHTPVKLLVTECLDSPPREDHWDPNVLKADVTLAVPQEKTPDGPWWVRGRGARLVDGIFVGEDERPHGYVINLRRRHAPELSANRNKLQHFDKDLAHRDLAGAVEALTQWDPMPLIWLWDLVRGDVRLGEAALERLLAADIRVSVGEWHGRRIFPALRSPLTPIGCLPLDRTPHHGWDGGQNPGAGHRYFRWWRAQLVSDGSRRGRDARWVIGRPAGFPRSTPDDGLLFRDPAQLTDPLLAALQASLDSGYSLRTTLRVLRRYAVVGIAVPSVDDLRSLDAMEIDPLLPDLYDAYLRGMRASADLADLAPPAHFPVLPAAARMGRTLGEVTELVRRLRALDPRIPEPPEPGELARHIPDQDELALLGAEHTGTLDALPAVVTPSVAAYVAMYADVPVSDVLNTARRYEQFGYRVIGDAGGVRTVDAEHRGLDESFGWPELLDKPFSLLRLVRLSAARCDADIGVTAAYVREVAEQMSLGEVSPGPLASVKAPAWWANFPVDTEQDHRPLSTWTVLRTLAEASELEPTEDVVRSVGALAAAGLVDTGAADAVRTWMDASQDRRPHLLTERIRHARFRDQSWTFSAWFRGTSNRVDTLFLLVLAADQQVTLGEMAKAVREQAEPYGIAVDEVPLGARDQKADLIVIEALTTSHGLRWKTEITYKDLIPYAHVRGLSVSEAMAQLRAYEPLGGPRVPFATPIRSGQWAEPDEQTVLAVESLLSYEPLYQGTVTPLALTVTAVRMGLGLRSTFRALVPYTACGVTLDCLEPADDDHDPDWRDVVILTQRLTGGEPALSGEVTDEHVRLAAEETDLSSAEVRDRLAYYAPLFGFRLPPV
jgi:hypothetical protein